MEDNIYLLPDSIIADKIGEKIKSLRLRQRFTQIELAKEAQVSHSTVRAIERGEIGSFDSLIRVLRVLGALEVFNSLLKEEELSPNEYLKLVQAAERKRPKRVKTVTSKNRLRGPKW